MKLPAKSIIYADNASTTQLDPVAFEAMQPYLLEEFGNASQPCSFSRNVKSALKKSREIIATCIHAHPSEIYFTSGGTESDNWAIKGCALADWSKGATITSAIEHHAVLRSCETIERLGYPVVYLTPDKTGLITPDTLRDIISSTTNLISIATANNEIGTIQPISELCAIAHENGALFHTDAVQAVGHIGINVKDLDVDLLSASAHKFNGPKGIGFLYIKEGIRIDPFMNGGSQEHSYRAGTENVASIIGMATALEICSKKMQDIQNDLLKMKSIILSKLMAAGVDFIVNGNRNGLAGTLSLSFKNRSGEALLHRLDLMGVIVSTGAACDSKNTQISHVIKAIGVPEEYAQGTIRISLGQNNTITDAIEISDCLLKILSQ
ncbi:MAG: cysteine desulfurase [Ruminococcus flavefaciens]|nr:cysteine desulfurase [Ruminococcus flavefaciens]